MSGASPLGPDGFTRLAGDGERYPGGGVEVCDLEHGHEGNPATVYGHFGSRRNCIRIKATDEWVYDPEWETTS